MSGREAVKCPYCGQLMDVRARFCPGCGTPRSWVREQLEQESLATGVPYDQLLERERRTGGAGLTPPAEAGWAAGPATAAAPVTTDRRRLWIILGTIGGIMLLACVGCVVASVVLINRFDVNIGNSNEGNVVREQLELATAGRHQERWDLLHPDQQAFVPVELFETCAQYEDADSVQIFFSFRENNIFISRIGDVDARTVFYAMEDGSSTVSDFVRVVDHEGEWRWTMEFDDLRLLEAGRCP